MKQDMPFGEKVSLKGSSSMSYHTSLGDTSHQNPVSPGCCCWQLISNKDVQHTQKGDGKPGGLSEPALGSSAITSDRDPEEISPLPTVSV